MNYILIITHGRTGSTLLQGILNSVEGCHIKGENFNFIYDLFQSHQSLSKALAFKNQGDTLSSAHPWFGVADYNMENYRQQIASVIKNTLMPSKQSNKNIKYLGFKEIRYFDLFESDPSGEILSKYLDFLTAVLHPCKLILLQRNLDNVLSSGWWANTDKELMRGKLSAFNDFLCSYSQKNKKTTFCIQYEDLINQGKRLYQLFSFLDIAPTDNGLSKVLLTKHSYNIRSFQPYSVPLFNSQHPKILTQANLLHANQKFIEAKKLYSKFVHQYEQGDFNRLPLYASVRAGRQAYIVRKSKQYQLAYFPIPKSACTSISQMLYQVINDTPFVDDGSDEALLNIHDYFDAGFSELSLDEYKNYFKFTVVRDPIERFISAYRNRIIYHGDLDDVLASMELSDRPSINEFAMDLESHISRCLSVELHFQPVHFRLGSDLSILDKVFPIEEINKVATLISKAIGRNIVLPHVQTGGPKYTVHDLSSNVLEKLIGFYQKDYELLTPYYTAERIREVYNKPLNQKDNLKK